MSGWANALSAVEDDADEQRHVEVAHVEGVAAGFADRSGLPGLVLFALGECFVKEGFDVGLVRQALLLRLLSG